MSTFLHQEEEHNRWRDHHPRGHVLNVRRGKSSILHRADCPNIRDWRPELGAPTNIEKVRGDDRADIEAWAVTHDHTFVTCTRCDVLASTWAGEIGAGEVPDG